MDVSRETPDVTTKQQCYELANILVRIRIVADRVAIVIRTRVGREDLRVAASLNRLGMCLSVFSVLLKYLTSILICIERSCTLDVVTCGVCFSDVRLRGRTFVAVHGLPESVNRFGPAVWKRPGSVLDPFQSPPKGDPERRIRPTNHFKVTAR